MQYHTMITFECFIGVNTVIISKIQRFKIALLLPIKHSIICIMVISA